MWKRDKQRVYLSQGLSHNKALFATNRRSRKTSAPMPTLFRFLMVIALIGGTVAGSLYVLAEYFQPEPKEISKSLRGVKAREGDLPRHLRPPSLRRAAAREAVPQVLPVVRFPPLPATPAPIASDPAAPAAPSAPAASIVLTLRRRSSGKSFRPFQARRARPRQRRIARKSCRRVRERAPPRKKVRCLRICGTAPMRPR